MSAATPEQHTTSLSVDEVAWDLETLLPVPGKNGVLQLLDEAAAEAEILTQARGTLGSMTVSDFASFVDSLASLTDKLGRAGNYAMLQFTVDTDSPEVGALMQQTQERSTAIGSQLIFVEIELSELPDSKAEEFIADPRLSQVSHHLENLRRYRPFLLTEPEEIILSEKSVTGAAAWSRLWDEQSSAIRCELGDESVSLENCLAQLESPDSATRRAAFEAITGGLAPGIRTRGYIYNTLMADHFTEDRMRGYSTWISARNLSNEASDESVSALCEAVVGRYDIPHRWYALKAAMLGQDKLEVYDRIAPVVSDEAHFEWDAAKSIVLDAYRSFSEDIAEVVEQFFDNPWIDAPTRDSKRGGAFCAYTVPTHHPYLLLNWTSKRRDVLTLAHELGHGVHAYLARPQGPFHQSTPLTLAETASVFGETVTFGRLLEGVTDPAERLPLLAENLDGQIATVFRQVGMNRFESAVHTERRTVGELSVERFGELWQETQAPMLGPSVNFTEGYETWWSYIPHFIHTPGYVYAYAYGQLLALSVFARYEHEGAGFVPSYLDMLAAGGSKSPQALGEMVGVDLGDPEFWDGGLGIIDRVLTETEAAARACGRLS
ncbi:MAG TPA: oligoendopeptidase [Acidimicrobiaceae bacterium]|jgi:oligoendopeptidase F|nr:oligoendopeptidase [Acidimicrobiaceae bacterium]